MLSNLKEVQDTLADFISQDRYQVLVVRATDVELIYLLKMVQALDQREGAHVFGLFAQPVAGDAAGYVTSVLEALQAQLEPINKARVEMGQPSWPPFPATCHDRAVAAPKRLRAGIAHAATLVPGGFEHRLVFCLLPQSVAAPKAYADALSALLPAQKKAGPAASDGAVWPRVRIILRDDGTRPLIIEALRKLKTAEVLIYEPDLSPAALMDAMAREVTDPGLAEAQRMQMLTELASLDYAHGRLDAAVAKYEILYDYYRRHQVPLMQAFVLQGVGDVLRRLGRFPLARDRYAQGLTLALETQGLPLIMALAYGVGDIDLQLQRFPDAADHLAVAKNIATKLLNRPVEADCLEKIGDARLALNRPGEAIVAWRDAANVCRTAGYRERLASVLGKMAKTFGDARMHAEKRSCEAELAAVRAGAPLRAPDKVVSSSSPAAAGTGTGTGSDRTGKGQLG